MVFFCVCASDSQSDTPCCIESWLNPTLSLVIRSLTQSINSNYKLEHRDTEADTWGGAGTMPPPLVFWCLATYLITKIAVIFNIRKKTTTKNHVLNPALNLMGTAGGSQGVVEEVTIHFKN